MPFAAADHPAQPVERSRGVAAVDRVGELPRRHSARLAQEGLDLVLTEPRSGPVGRLEAVEQRREPAEVLTEPIGDEVARGPRRASPSPCRTAP